MGTSTAYVNSMGTVTTGNGTSYSTPVIAGLVSCLLQYELKKNPSISIQTIIDKIIKSGHLYNSPTPQMGYGIPNFKNAMTSIISKFDMKDIESDVVQVSYINNEKSIKIQLFKPNLVTVRLYTMNGCLLMERSLTDSITYIQVGHFNTGVYAVCVSAEGKIISKKLIVNS
jgi:hypothetical protein